MKTILLLFFVALGAGPLAAQSLDPTIRTNVSPPVTDYHLVMHSRNPYEVGDGRFIYGGMAVELYQAKNPVKLLTAPNPDQPPLNPTAADRVWEQNKSDRTGLNILWIKF